MSLGRPIHPREKTGALLRMQRGNTPDLVIPETGPSAQRCEEPQHLARRQRGPAQDRGERDASHIG